MTKAFGWKHPSSPLRALRKPPSYLASFTIACLFTIACNLLLYRLYAQPAASTSTSTSTHRQVQAGALHTDDLEKAIAKAFHNLRVKDMVNSAINKRLPSSSAEDVSLKSLAPISESTLCPGEKSDVRSWAKERKEIEWTVGSHGKRVGGHGLLQKDFFCNKIAADIRPWGPGPPVSEFSAEDVVVGVYSGEKLAFTRAAAVIDTYFADTDAAYAYASTPVPGASLEFLAGWEAYKGYKVQQPDRKYNSAVHDVNMILIHDIFRRHPERKWYVHAGCDTYINLDYMAKHLSVLDASQDLWLASVLTHMSFSADQEFVDYMDKSESCRYDRVTIHSVHSQR